MFNELTYEADYKDKFNAFISALKARYGEPTDLATIRGKMSRIELKGNAVNQVLLSEQKQTLENCCVVTVRQEATVNQVYLDLDTIELLLSDGELMREFFEKMQGLASNIYTVQEKQVDNLGLLLKFVK